MQSEVNALAGRWKARSIVSSEEAQLQIASTDPATPQRSPSSAIWSPGRRCLPSTGVTATVTTSPTPQAYEHYVRRDPSGCWWWAGPKTAGGYGYLPTDRSFRPERFSYELAYGPIPQGMDVVQTCRNFACSRPEHLAVVPADEKPLGHKRRDGKHNPNAVLTEAEVCEMRRLRAAGVPLRELSQRFGVTEAQVSQIARGKRWAKATCTA